MGSAMNIISGNLDQQDAERYDRAIHLSRKSKEYHKMHETTHVPYQEACRQFPQNGFFSYTKSRCNQERNRQN